MNSANKLKVHISTSWMTSFYSSPIIGIAPHCCTAYKTLIRSDLKWHIFNRLIVNKSYVVFSFVVLVAMATGDFIMVPHIVKITCQN